MWERAGCPDESDSKAHECHHPSFLIDLRIVLGRLAPLWLLIDLSIVSVASPRVLGAFNLLELGLMQFL
jgi:hypothetical protein